MHEPSAGNGLYLPDLSIQGFRGIKDLSVSQLGRVTLITGKNNTGKSSMLEALRLLTNNAAPHIVYEILAFREEYIRGADDESLSSDLDNLFQVSALFHGFPRLSDDFGDIVIATSGRLVPMAMKMRVDWFVEEEDPDGMTRLIPS